MKIHCLFEQSGTFRDEFRSLGYQSTNYDIDNQFNKTDWVIDIFEEIDNFRFKPTIFSTIEKDDLVIAFFPCTYFCEMNNLLLTHKSQNYKNLTYDQTENKIQERKKERTIFLEYFKKLIKISDEIGFGLIIENPYHLNHLLEVHKRPEIIIKNRRLYGDWFVKPTGFWCYNFEPKHNFISLHLPKNQELKRLKTSINTKNAKHSKVLTVRNTKGIERSLISSYFAKNFIRKYILEQETY